VKYEITRRMDWQDYMLAGFVAVLCVAFMSFYSKIPMPFDLYLAMPIAKEAAFPGLYSHHDLIIQSGLRVPFYFYQIVGGGLYKFASNPETLWHVLYLLSLFVYFFGFWILAFEISQNSAAPSLTAMFLAAAPMYRGGLHETCVPLYLLVSAQAAVPIGFFALLMLFKGEVLKAFALSVAAFNLHPYVGVILLTFSAAVAVKHKWTKPAVKDWFWVLLTLGLLVPAASNIITNLSSNFVEGTAAAINFYDQFRVYSHHTFVQDYWDKEYVWFLLSLTAARLFMPFASDKKETMNAILLASFFLIGLYVLNLYILKKKFIMLLFLFRATYFLKPLIFLFVINGMQKWFNALPSDEKIAGSIAVTACFISTLVKDVYYADFFALIGCGFLMLKMTSFKKLAKVFIGIGAIELIFALACSLTRELDLIHEYRLMAAALNLTFVVIGTMMVWGFGENAFRAPIHIKPHPGFVKRLRLALFCAFFIFGGGQLIHAASIKNWQVLKPEPLASINERVQMSKPFPETRALISWIKQNTPTQSLFLVPPIDYTFVNFRLAAERGIFARLDDVNQLAFDTAIYGEVHDRLQQIGLKIQGPRDFDAAQYEMLTVGDLSKLTERYELDYAVFTSQQKERFLNASIAYQDDRFLIVDLKKLKSLEQAQ
jgi:hypothetical protein